MDAIYVGVIAACFGLTLALAGLAGTLRGDWS